VSVRFCQVEVSATGRSLVQRNPTDSGVSEFDTKTTEIRRPYATRLLSLEKNILVHINTHVKLSENFDSKI